MTVGNVLALLQTSIKRMLAYSSIAHSGYMLAAVLAGPGVSSGTDTTFFDNGIAAVLFYLLAYGIMNIGAFAVIASLERRRAAEGDAPELDHIDDLRGLNKAHPHLAAAMLLCGLSLLGFPPLLGFFGKLGLFTAIISTGNAEMYAMADHPRHQLRDRRLLLPPPRRRRVPRPARRHTPGRLQAHAIPDTPRGARLRRRRRRPRLFVQALTSGSLSAAAYQPPEARRQTETAPATQSTAPGEPRISARD